MCARIFRDFHINIDSLYAVSNWNRRYSAHDATIQAYWNASGSWVRRCYTLLNIIAISWVHGRWNHWNAYGCSINDTKVLAAANSFISLGLKDAGYEYVNIDVRISERCLSLAPACSIYITRRTAGL